MIKQAIRTHLLAQPAVSGLIAARMYLNEADQAATLPAIVYSVITTDHGHTHDGGAGFAIARFQLDCLGSSSTEAESLAEAVRNELQGFRGTFDTVRIGHCLLENELDIAEPPIDGSQRGTQRVILEFSVWYEASIPTL